MKIELAENIVQSLNDSYSKGYIEAYKIKQLLKRLGRAFPEFEWWFEHVPEKFSVTLREPTSEDYDEDNLFHTKQKI